MKPSWTVTILDADGEEHVYNFCANSVWEIAQHINKKMENEGDFYGHLPVDTINLTISRVVTSCVGAIHL